MTNDVVFHAATKAALTSNLHSLLRIGRFPRVAKRGLQMMIALEEDGFVSFG
jgi:hypothetical protein